MSSKTKKNSPTPATVETSRGEKFPLLAIVLVVIAIGLVLSATSNYGLMGWDSFPIIVTSRVQNGSDLVGTFTEELMDGRYFGHYYRPLLNLSFAIDYFLWGIDPFGYQLTNAVLFGLSGLVLYLFARRMYGTRAWLGPLVTLGFFLLHESHFEVIPVAARRPELLCAVFAGLSLYLQLGSKSLGQKWPWVPALWMAAAALSKETGYVLPALSVIAVFLWSPAQGAGERVKQAMRAALTHAAFVGAVLAARLAVLGGLGGPGQEPPAGGPSAIELSQTLFGRLFVPQSLGEEGGVTALLPWALGACFLLAVWVKRGGQAAETERGKEDNSGRAAILGLSWLLIVGLLYGVSRSIEQWYLYLPVAGLALVLGAGAELLLRVASRGALGRTVAMCGGVIAVSFCFIQVRYSPLLRNYPEWEQASVASEKFLASLQIGIEASSDGSGIGAPPIPVWYPPATEGPTIRGAAIMEAYSVQAWADLVFPERKITVVKGRAPSPPGSDELIVQITRGFRFEVPAGD